MLQSRRNHIAITPQSHRYHDAITLPQDQELQDLAARLVDAAEQNAALQQHSADLARKLASSEKVNQLNPALIPHQISLYPRLG